VKVADLGAMLRLRCRRAWVFNVWWCLWADCCKLLDASAAAVAWNFCAPVVDYDALRKEVQGLVAKLQKTQRAAEQALDKYVSSCALSNVSGCLRHRLQV
jgi:hypothetical protein